MPKGLAIALAAFDEAARDQREARAAAGFGPVKAVSGFNRLDFRAFLLSIPWQDAAIDERPEPITADGGAWCASCLGARWRKVQVPIGVHTVDLARCGDCLDTTMAESRNVLARHAGLVVAQRAKTFASFTPPKDRGLLQAVRLISAWAADPDGWLLIHGEPGCIAGETMIEGPDGSASVASRTLAGKPFRVWALGPDGAVPAWADAPFVKGVATLYRVRLSDGREITATAEHLFLTPRGWQPLGQLGVGATVAVAPGHPESMTALARPGSLEGGQDSWRTLAGCPDRCCCEPRQCGQPPRSAVGSDQASSPSRSDALAHTLTHCSTDDRAYGRGCSHLYPSSYRPSMTGFAHEAAVVERRELLLGSERFARPYTSTRTLWRSQPGKLPPQLSSALRQLATRTDAQVAETDHQPQQTPYRNVTYSTISRVAVDRVDQFYDLHVPVFENYLANGVWNHNSGKSHLGLAVANALIQRLRQVRWFYTPDLTEQALSKQFEDGFIAWKRELQECPVLVLDDIGAVHVGGTGWVIQGFLEPLMEARYRGRLPTLVTMIGEPSEQRAVLSESIGRRMQDATVATVVAWTAAQWKGEQAA